MYILHLALKTSLFHITLHYYIFLGPMFLHGDEQFMMYLTFSNFLHRMLDTYLYSSEVKLMDGIITGSDKEAALLHVLPFQTVNIFFVFLTVRIMCGTI